MASENLGVVVGVSGTAASRIALNWAARTARHRGLAITAVLAVPAKATTTRKTTRLVNRLMVYGVKEQPHWWVERVIDDTAEIVATSAGPGDPPKVDIRVVTGDPLDILTELAAGAELVVVGARRRSPWRAVRSSLGAKLLLRTQCPVTIVTDAAPAMPHPAHAPVRVRTSSW